MRLFLLRVLLFLGALLVCAAAVRVAGQDPVLAGQALLRGAVGTPRNATESLAKAVPLIMTGLSVALAFRAGFFNIGAEGQFLMGALAAAGLGTKTQLPWPLVLLGGAVAGAFWANIAGWMKLKRGAPEIITTIMLNYIAIRVVEFSLQIPAGPNEPRGWLLENASSQPQSDVLAPVSQIPPLVSGSNLHMGAFLALASAFGCWWFLFRSERGFLARAAGANPIAARAAGIDTDAQISRMTALCGALAGLGGAMEIAGATKQLGLMPPGYGFTAIAVALLADLNPLGVVPAALLFGMLGAGGGAMERSANIPAVTVSIVVGVLVCSAALLPRLRQKDS